MQLIINDKPAEIGMKVETFRSEEGILEGWTKPHKPSSSGKVFVRLVGSKNQHIFYPNVIGGKFK